MDSPRVHYTLSSLCFWDTWTQAGLKSTAYNLHLVTQRAPMCQHVRSERARVRESKRGRTKLKKGEGRGYRVIGIHAHKEVNECVKKMCVVCVFSQACPDGSGHPLPCPVCTQTGCSGFSQMNKQHSWGPTQALPPTFLPLFSWVNPHHLLSLRPWCVPRCTTSTVYRLST